MWVYKRKQGELSLNGKVIGYGYSGHGPGINDPSWEQTNSVGPLPAGNYRIGTAHDHKTKGPISMDLIPDPKQEMYGRGEFMIHGDSKKEFGKQVASLGCIVLNRPIREKIAASADRHLQVI